MPAPRYLSMASSSDGSRVWSPSCWAATWSAERPAWKFGPGGLPRLAPVRNAPLARAWSPAPSPLGRALSQVRPLKTSMSLRCAASGSRHGGSVEVRPFRRRRPVGHVRAVGDVDERHAARRLRPAFAPARPAPGASRPAAAGPRPCRGRATPSAGRSPCLHFDFSGVVRIWNGSLLTISISRAENRSFSLPRRFHDRVHGAAVVGLQAAAQGVGQHLLGQAADEHVLVVAQDLLAVPPGPRTSGRRAARRRRRSGPPPSLSRQAPTASKFSKAKPIGSIRWWQEAQIGVRAVLLHLLAERARQLLLVVQLRDVQLRRRRAAGACSGSARGRTCRASPARSASGSTSASGCSPASGCRRGWPAASRARTPCP